jgi:flagellar hook-length control protein FliK
VNNVILNAMLKSSGLNETKQTPLAKKESNKGFEKILKTISEGQSKYNDTISNKVDIVDKENTESLGEKSDDKDFDNLMQLIMTLGNIGQDQQLKLNSIDNVDYDKLKQMVSELILNSLSNGTAAEDISNDLNLKEFNTMYLNQVEGFGINSEEQLKQNIDKLASQIVDKLTIDPEFKEQLMSKLQSELQKPDALETEELKKAIISELSTMLKSNDDKKIVNEAITQDIEVSEEVKELKVKPIVESTNAKPLSTTTENKIMSKEDKLLKDLAGEDNQNASKENLSDRIANVVTRFEVIRTDKAIGAESQVTISRNNFDADFIKAIKFMDTNNIKELSVKIIPKDLGEIVIRISMDNGIMKANITAANKETYNLLNSQLPAISNQLSEQNMNIQSFNLSLYNGDNFLFSGNGSGEREGRQQGRKATQISSIEAEDSSVNGYELDESSINTLA